MRCEICAAETNAAFYGPWLSTPAEIEKIGEQFGFKKIGQGGPPKSIAGSHAKALLSYKLRELPMGAMLSKMTGIILDNLQIPYPSEDLFWMLLEKR